MVIDDIVRETAEIAGEFGLDIEDVDRTYSTISMKLVVDADVFIQIYGNAVKDKLNLTLVFKRRRLFGFDSEGGKYHCHPFADPNSHIFMNERVTIGYFVRESLRLLEENELL